MIQLFNISALKCQQHLTCNSLPFSLEMPNLSICNLYSPYGPKKNKKKKKGCSSGTVNQSCLWNPIISSLSQNVKSKTWTRSVDHKAFENIIRENCLFPSVDAPCTSPHRHLHIQRSCHHHQHFPFCQVLFEWAIFAMKTIDSLINFSDIIIMIYMAFKILTMLWILLIGICHTHDPLIYDLHSQIWPKI